MNINCNQVELRVHFPNFKVTLQLAHKGGGQLGQNGIQHGMTIFRVNMLSQLGSFNGFNQRRPVTLGVLKSTRIHHVRITMGKGKKDKFWLLYKRILLINIYKGFQRCFELATFPGHPGSKISKGVKKGPRLSYAFLPQDRCELASGFAAAV